MCSVCVSDLAFSFARFSYAFSLCLGPGIFLRAIFLGILAVFLTWHFASREFLISRPCILHHVFLSRVMVVPVRSIFERFGAFAPKMYMCLSAWAHTLFIYLSVSVRSHRKGIELLAFRRTCAENVQTLHSPLGDCLCMQTMLLTWHFSSGDFFARGTWKLNHVLLVL